MKSLATSASPSLSAVLPRPWRRVEQNSTNESQSRLSSSTGWAFRGGGGALERWERSWRKEPCCLLGNDSGGHLTGEKARVPLVAFFIRMCW